MSQLKIRRIPFRFDQPVDFIWNPANPQFSIYMNKISFLAVGFEKYICEVMRDAEALISDEEVKLECRNFKAQEGIHALHHRKHVNQLIKQHPGLQQALDASISIYEDLYRAKDLKYHLAYIGGCESTFTPQFKLFIDNREILYAQGDARVSSIFLWHFNEEIEHRASGMIVYDHLHGDYFYRLRRMPEFLAHADSVMAAITEGFRAVFPDVPVHSRFDNTSIPLPRLDRLKMVIGLLATQLPWHDPDAVTLPAYYHEWMERYESGEDMTMIYGVPPHSLASVAAE